MGSRWEAYKVGIIFVLLLPMRKLRQRSRLSNLLEVIELESDGKRVWPLTAATFCASQGGCAWLWGRAGDRTLGTGSHHYIDQMHKPL